MFFTRARAGSLFFRIIGNQLRYSEGSASSGPALRYSVGICVLLLHCAHTFQRAWPRMYCKQLHPIIACTQRRAPSVLHREPRKVRLSFYYGQKNVCNKKKWETDRGCANRMAAHMCSYNEVIVCSRCIQCFNYIYAVLLWTMFIFPPHFLSIGFTVERHQDA